MSAPVHPTPRRTLFYALATLPFVDCICDQLNNALHLTLGPISLLQALHGSLMLAFAFICLRVAYRDPSRLWRVPLPAAGAFLLLAMAATKELVVHGTLTFASIGPYGQMAYWVMLWVTVAITCDEAGQAEILLRGLAVGALATAASVFLGFVFGAENYYQTDAVSSSAGWFDTAKMVTGVLVTGGSVILYLGRERKGWLAPALACVCFAACILTYARAGSVALAGVLLWLPLWALLFGRSGRAQWVSRFLALALVGGGLALAVAGPGKLFARWGDVKQGDQAGSGRAAFWKIAADNYLAATPAEQALGRGYNAMAEMLFRDYGMDIRHTHNDLLDMLTVGGLAGACWLTLFIATLAWSVARSHIASVEGAAGLAILINYLLHSQFTGQIWGTDAMSYYMVSLACLSLIAQRQALLSVQYATAKTSTVRRPCRVPCSHDHPLRTTMPEARTTGTVLASQVEVATLRQAADTIFAMAAIRRPAYVTFATAYMLVKALRDEAIHRAYTDAAMVTPDGMPVAWCLRSLGYTGVDCISGPRLVPMLLQDAAVRGTIVGFYGGRTETLDRMRQALCRDLPALKIGYLCSPPFRALSVQEQQPFLNDIVEAGVELLFIGLGSPKQDLWMRDHGGSLSCVCLGVGAAFEFLSGEKVLPPFWVQRLGLTWLIRLYQEPRRLIVRNLYSPVFVCLFLLQRIFRVDFERRFSERMVSETPSE